MKIKTAVIGTGNIGTDLLIKIQKSEYLECAMFTGQNSDSKGIRRAKQMGIPTSYDSIKAIVDNPDCCDIVFDCTSARAHRYHASILEKLGKFTIDLTPSQIGSMCVPMINLNGCLKEKNVNVISCGGQAIIPIAHAIMKVHPETEYLELVSSISSRSAGAGTRINIDEYTQITKDALLKFTGVKKAKAIIILNPVEPPAVMHNTIYAVIKKPKIKEIKNEIEKVEQQIKRYVPHYEITRGPISENGRVTTMVEVIGLGDFLPKYAGNLDIINCAALNIAEQYAKNKMSERKNEQYSVF